MQKESATWLLTLTIFLLAFIGCAGKHPESSSKPGHDSSVLISNTAEQKEKTADESLGILPNKGSSEAKKIAEGLESEEEARQLLRDMRKQEQGSESLRMEQGIAEFDKLNNQIQSQNNQI